MKISLLASLFLTCCCLIGCRVNRYIYVAEEPILLYEFPSFAGVPVLTASIGDTVSNTGTKHIALGKSVPVEYKGYRFYSPSARARFIRIDKVRSKKDAAIPGIAYAGRLKYDQEQAKVKIADSIGNGDDIDWFGQITYSIPVLDQPYAGGNTVTTLPRNAVVKIKRHSYDYWEVTVNDRKGYVSAFSILDYSKSEKPFIRTVYTGRTYDPYDEPSSRYSTPTTGAYIHTGPRGGQYYINSQGNKTYVPRNGGGRSIGSSYRSKSSGSSYRSSGSRGRR